MSTTPLVLPCADAHPAKRALRSVRRGYSRSVTAAEPGIDLGEQPAPDELSGDPIDLLVEEGRRASRSASAFPGLVAGALRLVFASGRRYLLWIGLVQVGTAALAGVQVLAGKDALAAIARGNTAGVRASFVPLLVLALATAVTGALTILAAQQQRVLGEVVSRATWERVFETTSAVGLDHYESAGFYDRVMRVHTGALFRPTELVSALVGLVGGVAGLVVLTVTLAYLQPILAVLLFAGGVPMWLASRRGSRIEFEFAVATTENMRQREYLADLLTGRDAAKEVRAYDLSPTFQHKWRELYAVYLADLRAKVGLRTRLALIGTAVSAFVTIATIALLVWLVEHHHLSLTDAGAAILAIRLLAGRLQSTVGGISKLFECSLFLRDLQDFFLLRPTPATGKPTPPVAFPGIKAMGMSFRYPGTHNDVLHDVDLEVAPGQVVALVGENGSGKTTIAKLLAQLYTPTRGVLLWGEVSAKEYEPAALRSQIAVLFQDYMRYQLTATQNIGSGRADLLDNDAAVRAAAVASGADEFLQRLPNGYDTVLSRAFRGGRDLSLGQWQRVALARAFLRDAQFIILDEPTASLDARAEAALFASIRELFRDRSVLLIAHRFSSVRTADHIYVLHDGRVAEHGDHQSLMAKGGRYAELFDLQARQYLGR